MSSIEAEDSGGDSSAAWSDFTQIARSAADTSDHLTVRLAQRALRGEVNLDD